MFFDALVSFENSVECVNIILWSSDHVEWRAMMRWVAEYELVDEVAEELGHEAGIRLSEFLNSHSYAEDLDEMKTKVNQYLSQVGSSLVVHQVDVRLIFDSVVSYDSHAEEFWWMFVVT